MAWLLLLLAAVFEVAWAVGLKYSEGFTRPWISLATAVAALASLYFLALAVKTLPLGTAYAVWVGIGTVGTTVLGIALFSEPHGALRLGFLALLVVSLVGLKLSAPG